MFHFLLDNSVFSFSTSIFLGFTGLEIIAKVSVILGFVTTTAACITAVAILIYWMIKLWVTVAKFRRWKKNPDSDFE